MDKTIVVVDDFKANAIVMKSSLTQAGFNVIEENNPKKALDIFDGRHIDLLVTDFKMPEMNGAELTRAVKSIPAYRKLPVMILSSEKSQECKLEARKAGAYGWLNKPFDVDRFKKIVSAIF